MNARELQKQFPYLTMAKLKSGNGGYKTERGWMKHLEKLNAESEARCAIADFRQNILCGISAQKPC